LLDLASSCGVAHRALLLSLGRVRRAAEPFMADYGRMRALRRQGPQASVMPDAVAEDAGGVVACCGAERRARESRAFALFIRGSPVTRRHH
jgi:hypothetical protein